MKKTSLLIMLCALALTLALVFTLGTASVAQSGKLSTEEIDAILGQDTDASQITSPFIEVSNKVRGSVVGVNNYQSYTSYYYYGGRGGAPREQLASTGSGVVVTAYGHILTNYHVVEKASRVTVTIENSDEEFTATVVAYDQNLDLAVLHVPNLDVMPVELGNSDQLQVGEWAVVIGNPLGESFARTVTVGVVSALDRDVTDTSYDRYGRRTSVTNKMIQIDAAINSGNSGGGMFNILGQLQGIPARKYSSGSRFFSSGADVDNIGMCIPINVAKPLLRQVLESYESEEVTPTENVTAGSATNGLNGKPRMGVTIFTLRNSTEAYLPSGAYVYSVDENSPAALAGIQSGDIIVQANGTVVSTSTALVEIIGRLNANDTMNIKVYRASGLYDIVDHATGTVDTTRLKTLGEGSYIELTATLRVIDAVVLQEQ